MQRPASSGPILAGVCSRLARLLRCNVWVLRGGFSVLLLIKTLPALAVYGGLALLFRLRDHYPGSNRSAIEDFSLRSPQFASRNHRIRELDRRFREWEDSRTH